MFTRLWASFDSLNSEFFLLVPLNGHSHAFGYRSGHAVCGGLTNHSKLQQPKLPQGKQHFQQLQANDMPLQSRFCQGARGCVPVAYSAPTCSGGIYCDNSVPGHSHP